MRIQTIFSACLIMLLAADCYSQADVRGKSVWIYPDGKGRLTYRKTVTGDRIMDFSYAGYKGGGVALPEVPVVKMLKPSGSNDDSRFIQAAIDEAGRMPLKNGFRGAVLLAPGVFNCTETIYLSASGVVLRGSGSGKGGTTINMSGPKHVAFMIGKRRVEEGKAERAQDQALKKDDYQDTKKITDPYVPSGADAFRLSDVEGLMPGDDIAIIKPVTAAWVEFMHMHNLKREGKPQTWISTSRNIVAERKIKSISGNKITLDIPLSDSYNLAYMQSVVRKISRVDAVTDAGLENLHVQCPPLEIIFFDAPYSGVRVEGNDCWLKDIFFEETMSTTALKGKRITVQQVMVKHTYPNLGGPKPSDFSIEGSQILIDRCQATGGNTYFVWTGALGTGPNVVLNSVFKGYGSRLQPHQRWSTGLLLDNCVVPDGGIDFLNRGAAGSGHGWTMGWGVAWNCIAQNYVIQNPPGVLNWAIGCIGESIRIPRLFDSTPLQPGAEFDSHGTPVAPQSLYLAQLKERKGNKALVNLGYSDKEKLATSLNISPSQPLSSQIHPVLGENLALHRPVNASNVRSGARLYGAEKAVDGERDTYWATDDTVATATYEIDTEGPLDINAVELSELKDSGEGILSYRIEGLADSEYKLLSEGTTIGSGKIDRFPSVRVWKVKITILKAKSYPALREVGLYREDRE